MNSTMMSMAIKVVPVILIAAILIFIVIPKITKGNVSAAESGKKGGSKGKEERYAQLFKEAYQNTGNVRLTLKEVLTHYRTDMPEYLILRNAIDYLETSIVKDYATAFQMIEKGICSDEIKEMHRLCLSEGSVKLLGPVESEEEEPEETEE